MDITGVGGIESEESWGSPVILQLAPATATLSTSLALTTGAPAAPGLDLGELGREALARASRGAGVLLDVADAATIMAAIGAYVGGLPGALVGAVVGLVLRLLQRYGGR